MQCIVLKVIVAYFELLSVSGAGLEFCRGEGRPEKQKLLAVLCEVSKY